jgi:hypothetical protein
MTGVAGLPVMGPEAGTRLDRPGVPAGARRLRVDRGDRRHRPDGTPDPQESNAPCRNRQGAFSFGRDSSAGGDAQRGVHLVAEREAARVGVGLGGVEAVGHVGVADPVFEVDEAE